MMMLLALPQPGPRLTSPARAEAAWSSSSVPRPIPSRPDPPTLRMSRRVTPSCSSQRSLPACPGTMIIGSLPGIARRRIQFIRTIGDGLAQFKQILYRVGQAIVPSKIGILRTGTGTYVQDTFEGFPAPVALGLDRRGSLSNRRAKNRFNPRQQSSVAK